jgi:S-adenosylmethionine hydrolase
VAAAYHALAARAARMSRTNLITLLTDFGLQDPYVGVMKAVLLRHCPSARIVDLSHAVPPYDTCAAAFWIERVFGWFPEETVHIVVVDPGVGSPRMSIAIRAHGQYFVGPDNGVLSGVFACDAAAEARRIEPNALGLPPPSRTFHGRDAFAPIGAQLAAGSLPFESVGAIVPSLSGPVLPVAVESASGVIGQVVTVDRFGNAITNLELPSAGGRYEVRVLGRSLRIVETYADVAVGEACALLGAFGTLELAVREGYAATAIGVVPGTPVELRGMA